MLKKPKLVSPSNTDKPIQPLLVTIKHRIRPLVSQTGRRLSNLRFLRQNPDSPIPQILNQPSVVDVQIRRLVAILPRAPGQPSDGLSVSRGDGFPGLALERREAEGGKAERVAFCQARAGCRRRDVGDIGVVGLPFGDVDEVGPDVGGGDALYDDLVGDVVVGRAGEVFGGPDDGGSGSHF